MIRAYSAGSYNGNTIAYVSVDPDTKMARYLSASGTTIDTFSLDSVHKGLDGK